MKNRTYLLIAIFSIVFSTFCKAQSDIKKIKERVVAELMKADVDGARISSLIANLKENGTWPGIDYGNV
jgi:chondroitin AC lyase